MCNPGWSEALYDFTRCTKHWLLPSKPHNALTLLDIEPSCQQGPRYLHHDSSQAPQQQDRLRHTPASSGMTVLRQTLLALRHLLPLQPQMASGASAKARELTGFANKHSARAASQTSMHHVDGCHVRVRSCQEWDCTRPAAACPG